MHSLQPNISAATRSGPAVPTTAEQDQLKRFVRATHEMTNSRFIKAVSGSQQVMGIEIAQGGERRFVAPTYDWEDFRSFLTIFRKIALSSDEPIYLPKIIRIVEHYGDMDTRNYIRDSRREIIAIIEGRFGALRWGDSQRGKLYGGRQILDVLVNGVVFHEGQDLADDVSRLKGSEIGCHIFLLVGEIIFPVLNYCIHLRNIMWSQDLFPRSEFPPINDDSPDRLSPLV
jgi:hypothetical protein